LIITATNETFHEPNTWKIIMTNTWELNLDAGMTKEIEFPENWILTPDDRIRVDITNPKYNISHHWIDGCRTPSHHIAEEQAKIFELFKQTQIQSDKNRDAQILSDLWRADLLKDEIKEQLVQEHYQIMLQQIPSRDGIPSWIANCRQTFPFPNVYTAFTPALFVNGQVDWAPTESQTSFGMYHTNAVIASMTGGKFKNGDILQCKIDLSQTVNGQSWKMSLWSNKITLQGLGN
jgi:hypothetical protein